MKFSSFISFLILYGLIHVSIYGQTNWEPTICRVKYSGGGDWYSDPSSLPNLLNFININTPTTQNITKGIAIDPNLIKSEKLKKMSTIEANKLIYSLLDNEIKNYIHSLQILFF